MTTSFFLARLIGPFALALGLALLVQGAGFRTLAGEFMASPALIFLSGVITLPAGLAIVLTHNVWTPDWRVAHHHRRLARGHHRRHPHDLSRNRPPRRRGA